MIATDGQKTKIIEKIDLLLHIFPRTSWSRELTMMRLKYIYKDISHAELKKDFTYLKNIAEIAATINKTTKYDKERNTH